MNLRRAGAMAAGFIVLLACLILPAGSANATHTCGTTKVDSTHLTNTSYGIASFTFAYPGYVMLSGGVNWDGYANIPDGADIVTQDYYISGSLLTEYVTWENYTNHPTQTGIFFLTYCS